METLKIPMGDYVVKAYSKTIPVKEILFDEDNPRISLFKDSELTTTGNGLSQESIAVALMAQPSYSSLKRAIYENHGAMVPIWVVKEKNHYVVIEGNTRLFIYKDILDKEDDSRFETINCMLLDLNMHDIDNEIKDFIRLTCHLKGTTEWDKYEQAKYLYTLYYINKYPIKTLAQRTKLSSTEIQQDIKAYEIMAKQFFPKYESDPNSVHKYSYFKEYVKDKKLQIAMESNSFNDSDFSNWVGEGKFEKAIEIRKLKEVLNNTDACKRFIEKDFDRAMDILKDVIPQKSEKLYILIDDMVKRLGAITYDEINELKQKNSQKRKLLLDLDKKVNGIIKETEK